MRQISAAIRRGRIANAVVKQIPRAHATINSFSQRFFTVSSLRHNANLGDGNRKRVGVCFDIDGVLLRGSHVLPGAFEALDKLDRYNVPYIFLTNGMLASHDVCTLGNSTWTVYTELVLCCMQEEVWLNM